MNCIWILLLLFCGGNGNSFNNGCGCNRHNHGCMNCNQCRHCNNCNHCESMCDRNTRESTCETLCETVCENVCEAANDRPAKQDCGCARSFPYTSYPVLNNCD